MSHETDSHGASTAAPTGRAHRSFTAPLRGTLRVFGPSLVVGLVAPFIFPPVRRAFRPIAIGLIKGGLLFGESIKEASDDAREHVSDLYAEAKAQLAREAEESASKDGENA
jgi:hypothetical protein